MAQNMTAEVSRRTTVRTAVARPKRMSLKQRKEQERAGKIEQLTQTREALKKRLTEISEEIEAISVPQLEGETISHRLYGEGTVDEQKADVLTIRYGDTVRRQKLPVLLTGGTATVDDEEAMKSCSRLITLQKERSSLESKIQMNWHGLDVLLNPPVRSRRAR